MKKIENIIDSCNDCKYCDKFDCNKNGMTAYICRNVEIAKKLITIDKTDNNVEIPSWCPLETYNAKDGILEPKTVILNGLEWMTKNLAKHGGTVIDGNWYYTRQQAMKAVEEIGDGWRLPTYKEFEAITKIERSWDDVCKGRWLGENKELFLPALGYAMRWETFSDNSLFYYRECGEYLCNKLPTPAIFHFEENCTFLFKICGNPSWCYSVRLVRDIKK